MTRHATVAEMTGWSILGLGAGLIGGLVLRGLVGGSRLARVVSGGRPTPRRAGGPGAASAVRDTLARHDLFGGLDLAVSAVGPGVIELEGRIADRATRSGLIDLVGSFPGITRVIDSLTVGDPPDAAAESDERTSDHTP